MKRFIFIALSVLFSSHAFAAADPFFNRCNLTLKTASGQYFEKNYTLNVGVTQLVSENTVKLTTGEDLRLTVVRSGSGYVAVLSTPSPQVYPPVAPTFFLRGLVPARVEDGHAQVLLLNYARKNDPELTGINLSCFLRD